MVYCGKPSKGCSHCRERKIRCDQREPGCGQCEKRQQTCPGYRNMVDLMFRDESSHVIKKATKARSRRKGAAASVNGGGGPSSIGTTVSLTVSVASSTLSASPGPDAAMVSRAASRANSKSVASTPSRTPEPPVARRYRPHQHHTPKMNLALLTPNSYASDALDWSWKPELASDSDSDSDSDDDNDLLPSPGEGTWPATPMSVLLYTIAPSFQERGTAYFFSRYVAGDENACHQNYDFVYDIWKPVSMLPERQVDGVLASMTAVGLAGLSVLTRCPPMMDWARRSYGTALRLTNDALQNAREAIKDSTMLSVLILGTYEMLTGRTPQTVRAWQEHVNGAAALAKMRGAAQFQTRAGIRMFMMSHQTVMIACLHQDIPMPQALIDLRDDLGRLIGTGEPGWRIPEPIYKALQVRYDVRRGFLTDTDVIIQKLTRIDEECLELSADFPRAWAYRVVGISRPNPVVIGNRCHVYPSLLVANAWNGVRTIRLLVHETIIGEIFKALDGRGVEAMPATHRRQLARSVALLRRVRDAIIASVPQYFGVVSFKDAQRSSSSLQPPSIVDAKNPAYHVAPSPAASASASASDADAPRLRTPSPPLSTTSSSSSSTTSTIDFTCPTILDPMQSGSSEERLERFMTIASASHTIVWPLYILGMASCCTYEVKEYAIERLLQIHREGNLVQAGPVARMVQEKEICCPWADMSFDDVDFDGVEDWSTPT